MEHTPQKMYYAIGYSRLSKDDYSRKRDGQRDRNESDSISNQRKLIREYVDKHDNIILVDEQSDDGYTGTNYDRPGFCAVLAALQAGKANCVIVKDLSRLGREYIETGKYLEMIFPDQGIRFIAINDDVDSDRHTDSDDLLIPVKNLINESYCRELSKKLRAQFALQRKNGEFIGAFAAFGYRRSPDDKHILVVDEFAAQAVKEIFSLKMQGYSQQSIADALNKIGIPSPLEYKKQCGLRYQTGFQSKTKATWSATAIRRILTNPLYIGQLVQGKRGTPNYKVKIVKERAPSDWVVIEHNHEPIIDELMFTIVQRLLQLDTRTSPKEETVQPFSGLVFCGDCGRPMRRRVVSRGNKRFYYFTCERHVGEEGGRSHNFSEKKLATAVLHAVQNQVQAVSEIDCILRDATQSDLLSIKRKQMNQLISQKLQEMDHVEDLRVRLYEALSEHLIEREEYHAMRQRYGNQMDALRREKEELENRLARLEHEVEPNRDWIHQITRFENIQALNREAVVSLIDRICIQGGNQLRIDFNFRDEMADAYALLDAAKKEAV